MRGWGSSFFAAAVGVALLCLGLAQLDAAFVAENATVEGKVERVETGPAGAAIGFAGTDARFLLAPAMFGLPPVQSLRDASHVVVHYDVRGFAGAHPVVGLEADGVTYLSPGGYQAIVGFFAFVALVPGALFLMLGLRGLSNREVGVAPVPECAVLAREAVVIAFPRRPHRR